MNAPAQQQTALANSAAPIRCRIVREWRWRAACSYTLRDAQHLAIHLGATPQDAAEALAELNGNRAALGLGPYLVDDHDVLCAAMELALSVKDVETFPPPELGGEG